MAPKAVLQPDLSISVQYKDGATQVPKVITIGEALQAAQGLGYNTIMLRPTYWDFDCYTSIIAFNIPQLSELYLANSDLFTGGLIDSAYLQKLPNWYGIYFGNIYYQNNSWYVRNTGQLANIFSRNTSYSGIYYGECQVSDNTNYPIYLYTSADIETLYINNVPVIEYTWKSVLSLNCDDVHPDNAFWQSDSPMLLSSIDEEHLVGLDVNTPITNLTEGFTIKQPSLSSPFASFTTKGFRLSNKNYATITLSQHGLVGNTFQLVFRRASDDATIGNYSFNVDIGDGTPYLGFIVDSENQVAKLNVIFEKESYNSATGVSTPYVNFNTISMTPQEMSNMYEWLYGSTGEDTSPEDTEVNPDQGDDDNDPVINIPLDDLTEPVYGAVSSGFIKLYEMTPSQLADLADYMWNPSFIENLSRLFSDPRELIVGLSVFPLKPSHTHSATVRAGNLSTGVSANILDKEYETRYVGSARVFKGKSNFMSFGPYRRIRIFLPYCGEHELDPSAVYGKKLSLTYHWSFFSGTCVAELKRDGEPFMYFGGQIGFQIPISSVDYTRTISAVLSAGASIGSAIMTGGGSLLFPGTVKGNDNETAEEKLTKTKIQAGGSLGISALNTISKGFSPNVSYNSAGGSTTGFVGSQQPYLVYEEAIAAFDGEQDDFVGVVQKKVRTLSDCKGYTKVIEVHLEGIGCTGDEQTKIAMELSNGVIIKDDGSSTPTATASQLVLLKNLSENNVIGKKWDSTTNTVTWQNLNNQSISKPAFLINGDCTGYNYCYIPAFKRFYFIDDYKLTNSDMQELHLSVDVLQSFKDDILDCKAVIDRGTGKNNAFIEDPYKWTQANKEVSTYPFSDKGLPVNFDHQQDTYILAIASGNN